MSATYEEILSRMCDAFTEQSGFTPDQASDIGIRMRVLAGEIHSLCGQVDWLSRQSFPQTAVGQELDYHAQTRGLSRKNAVTAQGELTFTRAEALWYDVPIAAGTVCSTTGVNGLRFVTAAAAVLPAGQLSVTVAARADQGGEDYNVAPGRVTVMITPPSGITGVQNGVAFTGGVDGESDEALRARLLKSYAEIPNGTNAAFYRDQALRYEGISTVSVVPMARGTGTVDVYVACNGAAADPALMEKIEKDLSALREICVSVKVKTPTLISTNIYLTVTPKEGYAMSAVRADCTEAVKRYFAGLAIGQPALLAGVGQQIFAVEGVKNYAFNTVMCSDKNVTATQLAVLGTVGIAEGT